ncbi:Splicing factor 3A subunit 2, variant 3 [Schistosoma haematobium]|uniref:Splicing factor 3A subunit 2, variant 3 n=1 Tax=Schistosoma haematobium TaxID=6185 RepID=A0A922LV75_SCHHA|nr:Splicing factor 3A subunit 2, variant 3 [Schistosoma haematobium]KAH9594223.1 Splicing factor 3A subunit 2, variant 3 [Schistosoma haematobium]
MFCFKIILFKLVVSYVWIKTYNFQLRYLVFSSQVTKQKDPDANQQSMLFQIDYPEIADASGVIPRHRFMSAYEQHVEPPDKRWQYLLFAAEPYETIAFKIPSREVDKDPKKLWTYWNSSSKQFFLQVSLKLLNKVGSVIKVSLTVGIHSQNTLF